MLDGQWYIVGELHCSETPERAADRWQLSIRDLRSQGQRLGVRAAVIPRPVILKLCGVPLKPGITSLKLGPSRVSH